MTDWQPIESAPNEGCILVFGGRHKTVTMVEADGDWWNSREGKRLERMPTHWMPLPSPPTTMGASTGEAG